MRFADLLGEPDDGNAPKSSTPDPAAADAPTDAAPGASGSLSGLTDPADDDIARWFTPDESPLPTDSPVAAPDTPARASGESAPTRGQALAQATGATEPADAFWDDTPAEPAAEAPSPARGVDRDDLMPARQAHHKGRRKR